ncbi:hypothetical protein SIID45300_00951 [Candidatus Magnetaquicoccaceae bacterium FCR-1]|uniref:Energy transducer TonB n=1 Tax=Candidatus Magnetaquiglobus chichijimensis TaxID=3141448 RepID=A0ABQ0C6Y1_9PROT
MFKAPNLEPRVITPDLRRKMNLAGIVFFILALLLIAFLTHNFSKEYDPAHRAIKDKEAMEIKAAKKAAEAKKFAEAQAAQQQANPAPAVTPAQPIPVPPKQP